MRDSVTVNRVFGLLLSLALCSASSAREPTVALLESAPRGNQTLLVLQSASGPLESAAAVVEHVLGGIARGAVQPGTSTVYAVVDRLEASEVSWAASLVRMEPGKASAVLVDRVYHASRPIVLASGRVFVQRGRAGVDPTIDEAKAGRLRVDSLSIDEVMGEGRTRSVHAFDGYVTYLAGALSRELIVYRVWPSGADLVAVGMDDGRVRTLVSSLLPYARDFSVDSDSGTLFFTERDDADASRWWAQRLDLASGAVTRITSARHMALFPHAWPGGALFLNPEGPHGMVVLGAAHGLARPFGDGGDELRELSTDGSWLVGVHTVPGSFELPFVVSADGSRALQLPVPAGTRVDVAGFVPGGAP